MSELADIGYLTGQRVLVSGGTKVLGGTSVEHLVAGGASAIIAARTITDQIEGVE